MSENLHVAELLAGLDLTEYLDNFRDHHISYEMLASLSDADLSAIGVRSLGHRKKFLESMAAKKAVGPASYRLTEERARSMMADTKRGLFLIGDLPSEPLKGAVAANGNSMVEGERSIALLDISFFGHKGNGIIFSDRAVYWKCSLTTKSGRIPYDELRTVSATLTFFKKEVRFNGQDFSVAGVLDETANAAVRLAKQICDDVQSGTVAGPGSCPVTPLRESASVPAPTGVTVASPGVAPSQPEEGSQSNANPPAKNLTLAQSLASLFVGIALIGASIHFCDKSEKGVSSSRSGVLQNGQIPGYSACLDRLVRDCPGCSLKACCDEVGGDNYKSGTFPTCEKYR